LGMQSLNGKTAVVTGGGTGIGAACALALADAGCRVAILGRREDKLRDTAAQQSAGEPISVFACDVADRAAVDHIFQQLSESLGRIDILVNSAGVNIAQRSMKELQPSDWDLLLQVNATGAYNCMRSVLPGMREQGDGVIINICSVAGLRANLLGGVAYNASKFAMAALGTTVAQEEKDRGIRVSNVYPGEVETPILDHRPVPVSAEHRSRILQPEDVAAAVMMIVSLPPRAHIPDLVIKPTTQTFA
jgi:NADP-dependent 3-hydroxy acid dehydrogenase YdfG